MDSLGSRIKWLREKRQLSQRDVALRIGVTEATLSRYETNKRLPDAGVIIALADILGVTSDFLLCLSDMDKPWWSKNNAPDTTDIEELIRYSNNLTLRGKPLTFDDNYVFYSSIGGPLVHNSWRLRLDVYGGKLGIRIAPYDLRHTFAVMYLRGGGDSFSLQRIMGHADMSMTRHYANLTQADIEKRHTAASPLNILVSQKKRIRSIN